MFCDYCLQSYRFVSKGGLSYIVEWVNELSDMYSGTAKNNKVNDILCNLLNSIICLPVTSSYITKHSHLLNIFKRLSKQNNELSTDVANTADNLYTHWRMIIDSSNSNSDNIASNNNMNGFDIRYVIVY